MKIFPLLQSNHPYSRVGVIIGWIEIDGILHRRLIGNFILGFGLYSVGIGIRQTRSLMDWFRREQTRKDNLSRVWCLVGT